MESKPSKITHIGNIQASSATPYVPMYARNEMQIEGVSLNPYIMQAPTSQSKGMKMQQPRVLLGPNNTPTVCPICGASIRTAVKYTTTTRTHITAALFCLICLMCCIPYCLDSARNTDHYCPNCNCYIGTYEK